jgi:hypothetical protein
MKTSTFNAADHLVSEDMIAGYINPFWKKMIRNCFLPRLPT